MIEPLAVLYEDAHLLAANKPAGLLTQGTPGGEPTLERVVRDYLATDSSDPVYLGTVHRLDRPVSGVVVWAKTEKAARRLAQQFAARATVKEYWAVVDVQTPPPSESGVWDDWLTDRAGLDGLVRAVAADSPGARRAVSRFQFEPASADSTLRRLRLWPETGRTHQLRVQASLRGLPVVGDTRYGSTRPFPQGIALHARSLAFDHPVTRRKLIVTAPLPEGWPSTD